MVTIQGNKTRAAHRQGVPLWLRACISGKLRKPVVALVATVALVGIIQWSLNPLNLELLTGNSFRIESHADNISYDLEELTTVQVQRSTQQNNQIVNKSSCREVPNHQVIQYARTCFTSKPWDEQQERIKSFSTPPPLPWIHVGLPKTGTTSLESYWNCGGNYNVSHHTCKVYSPEVRQELHGGGGPTDGSPCPFDRIQPCRLCGDCMKRAVLAGLPPLASCGAYDAWAQIDALEQCYMPQLFALERIHKEHPQATLILLHRNVAAWVRSVRNFRLGEMQRQFTSCGLPYLPVGQGDLPIHLEDFYCSMMKHVRRFASTHPSHLLLEFNLDDAAVGHQLERVFGLDAETCWGEHNVNQDQKDIPDCR